jgi:hypothetical protein
MKFFEKCWLGMINCFEINNTYKLELKIPDTYGKVYSYVDLFEANKNVLKSEYEVMHVQFLYFKI